MNKCVGCTRWIWFFQKHGLNEFWHKKCWGIWLLGYEVAMKVSEYQNRMMGYRNPWETYKERNYYTA